MVSLASIGAVDTGAWFSDSTGRQSRVGGDCKAARPERDANMRYTKPVRRGLVLLLDLFRAETEPSRPPMASLMREFTAPQTKDLNKALEWLEGVEAELDKGGEQPDLVDPAVEVAASPAAGVLG